MSMSLVNIIFGMKVRQARLDAGFSASEFAKKAKLSASYLTEIEKGRKYPKADKIMLMAGALGKEYDDLVSIKLGHNMGYLETALKSPLISQFPYEAFGLELNALVEMLTRAPEQSSALLHAVTDMTRQAHLEQGHLFHAMLRSYQEINDNYFEDIEEAAVKFNSKYGLTSPIQLDDLQTIITKEFGVQLNYERLATHEVLSGFRSVFIAGNKPILLLNHQLSTAQHKYLLAREIGYSVLGLEERSPTSSPDRADSYQQVLNDFKASYFAGAVTMPEEEMVQDIEAVMEMPAFNPTPFYNMLDKYDATPEMLLYRFSELIPQFFGVAMHFLRMNWNGKRYQLYKQLNMSRLLVPSGLNLKENFCRRWLTVRLIRELSAKKPKDRPHIGVQMSEFLDSRDRFLCIGFSRPLSMTPQVISSGIVGFRVDNDLKNTMRFWNDPDIPSTVINETCERCPLTPEQCEVRAVPPSKWQKQQNSLAQHEALRQLKAELRKI